MFIVGLLRKKCPVSLRKPVLLLLALGAALPACGVDERAFARTDFSPSLGATHQTLRSLHPWGETQAVTAPGATAAFDNFGLSSTVCGDVAVVGAWHADLTVGGGSSKVDAGAAYVYERSLRTDTWTLTSKLVASDAAAGDSFGFSVACHGDTIAVGAMFADVPSPLGTPLSDAGAVYLFERQGDGWRQTQKLIAVDAAASDAFGFALSMTSKDLLIGAPYVNAPSQTSRIDVGAAYIYTRLAGGFTVAGKLMAQDGGASDFFGRAVAISGETALIGAMHSDVITASGKATDAGAAFVFVRDRDRWIQQQVLTARDAASRDLFGFAVALDGDTAVVGAYLADLLDSDGASLDNAGAAYIFARKGGVFSAGEKLVAPDASRDDYFGTSVAIAGERVVVGAPYADLTLLDDSRVNNGGAVYAFRRRGDVWHWQDKLVASDVADRDVLGRGVALWGHTALLSAPGKLRGGRSEVGAAYFFDYTPLTRGAPCHPDTGAVDCDSGFCSAGVCCDSACAP